VSDEDAIEAAKLPLTALDVPSMVAALARWRNARSRQTLASGISITTMPPERQADPLGLPEAAGYTGIIDVLRHPLDFRFRHFGTDMARAIGADYTGQRVSTLKPNRYVGALMAAYVAVANGRAPELHSLVYRKAGRLIRYTRLLMPLSSRGLEVDTIWAVTHYSEGLE
jgi:hypothetical protein